ncbi:MAG: hypothetical protein V8R26_04965 [Clostridia bacterium]
MINSAKLTDNLEIQICKFSPRFRKKGLTPERNIATSSTDMTGKKGVEPERKFSLIE